FSATEISKASRSSSVRTTATMSARPRTLQAWYRRWPLTTSYSLPRGRTRMGWMRPRERIDAARRRMSSSVAGLREGKRRERTALRGIRSTRAPRSLPVIAFRDKYTPPSQFASEALQEFRVPLPPPEAPGRGVPHRHAHLRVRQVLLPEPGVRGLEQPRPDPAPPVVDRELRDVSVELPGDERRV